jgi:chromosomal replication initiator protein
MYLASRHAHYSLKKIGNSLGRRDHTTIMHGCRNIEKLLQSDPACRKLVNELIAELESEP